MKSSMLILHAPLLLSSKPDFYGPIDHLLPLIYRVVNRNLYPSKNEVHELI